jgi:uncharacterized protein (UPF0210 family)
MTDCEKAFFASIPAALRDTERSVQASTLEARAPAINLNAIKLLGQTIKDIAYERKTALQSDCAKIRRVRQRRGRQSLHGGAFHGTGGR